MRTLIHPKDCSCRDCAAGVAVAAPPELPRAELLRRINAQADLRLTASLRGQAARRRARLARQVEAQNLDAWALAFGRHLERCLRELREMSPEDVAHGWAAATQLDLQALALAMHVWRNQQADERELLRRLRAQTLAGLAGYLRQEVPGHSLEAALLADDPLALIDE